MHVHRLVEALRRPDEVRRREKRIVANAHETTAASVSRRPLAAQCRREEPRGCATQLGVLHEVSRPQHGLGNAYAPFVMPPPQRRPAPLRATASSDAACLSQVSIPFKREGVSERIWHITPEGYERYVVSIPFHREGVSELAGHLLGEGHLVAIKFLFPSTGKAFPNGCLCAGSQGFVCVSIPFHREGVSELKN